MEAVWVVYAARSPIGTLDEATGLSSRGKRKDRSQWPLDEKVKRAQVVIGNSSL